MHKHGLSPEREDRILRWAAGATLAYVVLAFSAGLIGHSLALISEAGHNLADFLAIAMSWLAVFLQAKPPTTSKTFGYHRAGVLAAFLNVLLLAALTLGIVISAIERFGHPETPATAAMLVVGGIGVLMNVGIALALHHDRSDVNIRAAFLHMVGDAVSTALLILAALAIQWTGRSWFDPLLSLVIAGFIVWSSWDVWRETVNILLEGTPRHIAVEQVSDAISRLPGIYSVHDLHLWSLGSNAHALSCHIAIADLPLSESRPILESVQRLLAERYQIHHATIQFENELCVTCDGCHIR